jgi:hypothetical protein
MGGVESIGQRVGLKATGREVSGELKRLFVGWTERQIPWELAQMIAIFVTGYTPVPVLFKRNGAYFFLPDIGLCKQDEAGSSLVSAPPTNNVVSGASTNAVVASLMPFNIPAPPDVCGNVVFQDDLSKMKNNLHPFTNNLTDDACFMLSSANVDQGYVVAYHIRTVVRRLEPPTMKRKKGTKSKREPGWAVCELKCPLVKPESFDGKQMMQWEWTDKQKTQWANRQKTQWNLLPLLHLFPNTTLVQPIVSVFRNHLVVCDGVGGSDVGGGNGGGQQVLLFDIRKRTWSAGPPLLNKLNNQHSKRMLIADGNQQLFAFGVVQDPIGCNPHRQWEEPVEVFRSFSGTQVLDGGKWITLAPNRSDLGTSVEVAAIVDGERIKMFALHNFVKNHQVEFGASISEYQYRIERSEDATDKRTLAGGRFWFPKNYSAPKHSSASWSKLVCLRFNDLNIKLLVLLWDMQTYTADIWTVSPDRWTSERLPSLQFPKHNPYYDNQISTLFATTIQ